jgi:hypothetical protein
MGKATWKDEYENGKRKPKPEEGETMQKPPKAREALAVTFPTHTRVSIYEDRSYSVDETSNTKGRISMIVDMASRTVELRDKETPGYIWVVPFEHVSSMKFKE